jgi:hypothetical protein
VGEKMKAYRNGITKTQFVAELKKHQKADRFLQGTYWNNEANRGCAVGCGIKSINELKQKRFGANNHEALSESLGWPLWLVRLEDRIFENVSVKRSKTWPVEVAGAIKSGANLDQALNPILIEILKVAATAVEGKEDQYSKKSLSAIKQVIKGLSGKGSLDRASAAAAAAARAAAYAAAYADVRAAADAARAAAYAAAYADVRAAADAARAAAYAAAYAAACASFSFNTPDAYSHAMETIADKVLEVLRSTK